MLLTLIFCMHMEVGLAIAALVCIDELLSAVKACLIIVGARPTASQLVACIVTSLSYQP